MWLRVLTGLVVCAPLCAAWPCNANLTSKTWTLPAYPGTSDWPENSAGLSNFDDRPSTGLALGDGGVISYALAQGVFRALNDLGIIGNVKYVAGVNGGDWAATVFNYYGRGQTDVAANDTELLGTTYTAENSTMSALV